MSLLRRTFGRSRSYAKEHLDPEDVFLDSSNLSDLNIHQLQGQIEQPLSSKISGIFGVFVLLLLAGFGSRLYSMQIVHGAEYKEKADLNHVRGTPLFAHRGTIEDVNGTPLAWNQEDTTNATGTSEIPRRVYTSTPGFSHILGYVSYPKKDSSGAFWQDEYLGKDGVEKQYQSVLQGTPGEKLIAVSATHTIESENVIITPEDGENLKLTIDAKVQAQLYKSIVDLAAQSGFVGGAGVIMDVNTGAVLALASYPEYNNNLMTNASSSEEKKQVADDLLAKSNKFINRAVSGLFTPGSTVKPFMGYAALAENIITPDRQILSTGQLVIKNKYGGPDSVFKDWKAHGLTDLRKALAESSDEYFYQVGGGYESQKGLGIARIDQYSRMFGFASTTGIDLPGEQSGVIPTPLWKQKIFGEDWKLGDTYHTAIGQYGFQLTPLELVRADAAIANGGMLVTPHVTEIAASTPSVDLQLNHADAQVVREGMRQCVTQGICGALNGQGLNVAAKSGTAELGVTKQLVNSWISGFFPYDHPKYAFAIIMEKGSRTNLHGAVFAMKDTIEWMRDNTDYTK